LIAESRRNSRIKPMMKFIALMLSISTGVLPGPGGSAD
jgi:hypothetical protein